MENKVDLLSSETCHICGLPGNVTEMCYGNIGYGLIEVWPRNHGSDT